MLHIPVTFDVTAINTLRPPGDSYKCSSKSPRRESIRSGGQIAGSGRTVVYSSFIYGLIPNTYTAILNNASGNREPQWTDMREF
jgi:hypothetical protein